MTATVLLAASAVVFIVLPLLFRSSAVYMFIFLVLGDLMAKMVGQDVTQIINSFVSVNLPVISFVEITLLLILPVIVLFMFRRSSSGVKLLQQLIPAFSAALLAIMFVTAKLPFDMQAAVKDAAVYHTVEAFFPVAAVAGALSCFFYIVLHRPKHHDNHKGKHHK